ncbi:hypothetical protein VOLCADRAFT_96556 [Volvox carteri f. nagariensis]|uniref:Right handed beta helix domain-containing protein n=1 Tax=Volvox carteri f. nagariensis TaxID=3068 RepID=D8UAE8_VOLCA|nr:uncharacterized protein VOLCADRAFT_96556 [Volvox carteri f. nagariensis]EFJ43305.1 hypothetical protein VOLCADRAFT_96556 [Volvox carteri f. nagariensis]|eukprot:XP_002955665.1 hypothetical protein VOLCADRAFT_96556 [Volvox carteri f. nagariensis]
MRTFMFLLLLLFVAQQQHLSNAQTLQPIHTCSIVLRGASGFVEGSFSLAEFRLHCWWGDQTGTDTIDATNSSTDAAVKVQLGRNLLVSLKRSGGIPDLSGVQSDWSAAARPFTAISWDDDPYHDPYDNAYRSVMSEDWGLDIVNVPHLQLVDSVVSGIPLSSVGPLLQILNCSTLTTRNVTLEALHRPPGEAAYGAVRVTGLQSATFDGIRCSDVRDALGWACLLLEARPNAAVFIQGSLFVNNSVEFYHGVESSPRPLSNGGQPSTVAELQVAYPSPVYASYDNGVPTSSISEELPLHAVLCTEDDDNSPPFTGYGAILIIYQLDDKSLCNLEHPPGSAEINAIVVLERTVLSYNRGGCGAGISMRSPFAYEAVPECSVNRHVLVILRNSSITSNTADMHGGGIHYRDGWGGTVHLTIDEGSILSLNSAVTQGGGAALQGSHIGNVTISNTTVSYNKANNGGGLFFYAYGNLTTIRVSNSNLSYNNASSSGGAIWAKATTGPIGSILVNDGSILRGNKAVSGNGGAISLSIGGKSTSLKSLVVDGVSILSQNQAGHHGGAIFVEGQGNCSTTTNVLLGGGSELIDNWASGGNGGAMYLSICRLRSLSVVNASISKNMARCFHAFDHCDGDGGGIYAFFQDFPAGGISIREQAVLANNTALRHGGAMYIASQPGGEDSDRFPGNFSLDSSILTGNTAITGNGGAICVDIQADLSAVELSNTILKNNAAVCYDSDVLDGEFPDVLVRTSSGNDSTLNAGCSGGAMYLGMSSMKNPLLITGGSFLVNNSAQRHGGAIFVPERTQHPGLIVSGGSNVSYNMAGARGGAILLQPLLSADWPFQGYTLLFDMNSVASYNRAAYGGFLYMYGTGIDTQLRIDGSDFIGNSAVYDGGAIYMMLAPLDFQPSLNAIVERGSTVALNIAQGQGGAFYLQTHRSLNLTITGASDVSSNWAMSDGGGIYATVTGGGVEGVLVGGSSILSNNTALFGHGGALAIEV